MGVDELDRQMADAYRRQREAARRAHDVDRRGWDQGQWCADAKRLMYELDGAITSLVNGHATYLIAEVDVLREIVRLLAPAAALGEHHRPWMRHSPADEAYERALMTDG